MRDPWDGSTRRVAASRTGSDSRLSTTRLALAHGAFNVVGGLWPLVSMRSFEAVFGPKADRWLEHTVAGLLVTNGVTQLLGARDEAGVAHARRVGVGTAVTLLAIDIVYVGRGRLRWTYLLDAVMESGWLLAWSDTKIAARRSVAGAGTIGWWTGLAGRCTGCWRRRP